MYSQENTIPTYHSKIMIAKVADNCYEEVEAFIKKIRHDLAGASEMEIVRALKSMIPEYVSNHSRFEALDSEDQKNQKAANS